MSELKEYKTYTDSKLQNFLMIYPNLGISTLARKINCDPFELSQAQHRNMRRCLWNIRTRSEKWDLPNYGR